MCLCVPKSGHRQMTRLSSVETCRSLVPFQSSRPGVSEVLGWDRVSRSSGISVVGRRLSESTFTLARCNHYLSVRPHNTGVVGSISLSGRRGDTTYLHYRRSGGPRRERIPPAGRYGSTRRPRVVELEETVVTDVRRDGVSVTRPE